MGVYPQKKAPFYTYICRNMTHFRQSTKHQLPAYQYACGNKTASGVCLQNVTDYSPFGVPLDGRTIEGDGYRYSFQGQEHDDEVKGEGNSVNYKYRMHDPRVGRFFAVDPLAVQRSWVSPYNFVQNNPITRVDPTGALDDWYEDTKGNIEWRDETTKYSVDINSKGEVKVWSNIGKQLSNDIISKKGAGKEFTLFKALTDYKAWTSSASFNGKGVSEMNYSIPMIPQYYHPLMSQMEGTPSEDRITSNGVYFCANEGINFGNFSDAMIGAFVGGGGPENFYFGPRHSVSKSMANTQIVTDAVNKFLELNRNSKSKTGIVPLQWEHFSQTLTDATLSIIGAFLLGEKATTPANFIGGAAIKIEPVQRINNRTIQVMISIHNVTSVGSGNVENGQSFPRPILESSAQPYTNISQTIQIIMAVPLKKR
jgi:RHS repeat-associated protein